MAETKNLFIIETEYHLMASVSVICQCHSESGQENIVFAIQDPERRRLPEIDDSDLGFTYYEIRVNQGKIRNYKDKKQIIEKLLQQGYANCYLFLEHLPLERYIASTLKKRGSKVCLLPDGTKPYLRRSHLGLKGRIKRTIKNYAWLVVNRLWPNPLTLVSEKYAESSFLDEVWLTYSKFYQGRMEISISQFNLLGSEMATKVVNCIYKAQIDKVDIVKKDVVLYVNNIYFNKESELLEIELLSEISKLTKKPLYIKLHPHTSKEHRENIAKINGLRIIHEIIPVELLIRNLVNSVVISFWSAGLFVNNQTCKFYWLHHIMRSLDLLPEGFEIVNPTEHIVEIKHTKELFKKLI